jgi:hypothetical protein
MIPLCDTKPRVGQLTRGHAVEGVSLAQPDDGMLQACTRRHSWSLFGKSRGVLRSASPVIIVLAIFNTEL